MLFADYLFGTDGQDGHFGTRNHYPEGVWFFVVGNGLVQVQVDFVYRAVQLLRLQM